MYPRGSYALYMRFLEAHATLYDFAPHLQLQLIGRVECSYILYNHCCRTKVADCCIVYTNDYQGTR